MNESKRKWVERERERVIWAKDSNDTKNSNQNKGGGSSSGGGDGNNNKPKCSKCKVNDAKYPNLTVKIKDEKGNVKRKVIWDKPLCDTCWNELTKCQECKQKGAEIIDTKNNSEIILCSECHKKLKELENPKCKRLSWERLWKSTFFY